MVLFSSGVYNDKGAGGWDRKWVIGQFSIEIFIPISIGFHPKRAKICL